MDVATLLVILRRRWWVIALITLLSAGLALGFSLTREDRFEASADLLFETDDFDRTLFGGNGEASQGAPERIAATNLALASLDAVTRTVKRRMNSPLSVEELENRRDVEPKGQADIVTITAEAESPAAAVELANAFADEVESFRRRAAQAKVQRAIDALRVTQAAAAPGTPTPEGQDGISLSERLDQLSTLKAVQTGDVTVVQRAVPPDRRSSPRPLRNTLVGGLLGLILGIFAALLLQRLDRRVSDEDEVARIVQAPVLSRVPVNRRSRARQQHFLEALQFLRVNLQLQDPQRKTTVIAVTSPLAGDGKTAITAGLAQALALSGHSVIAVDCDLRKPMLHEHLHVERRPGLIDGLVERVDVDELLQDGSPGLRVLSAGRMPLDSFSIVLALQRLPEVLDQLRTSADYVIVDTPPISVAVDASTVAAAVDGVVLVVDVNRARRDVLGAAHDQLAHARANLLGVTLNRAAGALFGTEYGGYRAPDDEDLSAIAGLGPGSRRP